MKKINLTQNYVDTLDFKKCVQHLYINEYYIKIFIIITN